MDSFINAVNDFIGNTTVTVILVSMVPLIELKGSILWGRASGLGFFSAFWPSFLGSTLIGIPIFFLLVPILNILKKWRAFNKLAVKCESYVKDRADKAIEKRKDSALNPMLIKQIAVFIFIAIPLPMTGIWTGTAVAVFLGLKFKEYILPAVAGNFVAGFIISVLAELFTAYVNYILYGLFALAIIFLIVLIVKVAMAKPKSENGEKKD